MWEPTHSGDVVHGWKILLNFKFMCVFSWEPMSLGSVTTRVSHPAPGNMRSWLMEIAGFAVYWAKNCWTQIAFCMSINKWAAILTFWAKVDQKSNLSYHLFKMFSVRRKKVCLLPFENHSFPIMKAGGHFQDGREAWEGLMATGMKSVRYWERFHR